MPPQTRSTSRRSTRSSTKQQSKSVATTKTTSSSSKTVCSGQKKSGGVGDSKIIPPPKRARHASPGADLEVATIPKRVKGKRGKLEAFMNLPIEIFSEIAIYLYPLDLIVLARTNKFFRQVLMRRSAIKIWRSAERNVDDLPPCPKDLCEPQYAALVFTKNCSMCGKTAVRPMDPILQVRLCVRCRDDQVVSTQKVSEPSLVFSSRNLVPERRTWRQAYCLLTDARAVKAKLNALALAGDQEETNRWKTERWRIVANRVKEAGPIAAFLKSVEEDHDAELIELKKARKADIESRLLELGWIKGDFQCYNGQRMKQWTSLVYTSKPLTSHGWENLLPTLIPFLELNREERLRREASSRLQERRVRMQAWLGAFMVQLEPFARVTGPAQSEAASFAASGSSGSYQQTIPTPQDQNMTQLSDMWILKQSSPNYHDLQERPELKSFPEKDIPLEAFEHELEGMRPKVEELIQEWRSNVERTLVRLLQRSKSFQTKNAGAALVIDPLALGANLARFTLSLGASSPIRPIDGLSSDLQLLLRADSAFKGVDSSIYFYPDDFSSTWFNGPSYDASPSKIATALLTALDRPDAMYLELKAAGKSFICGRCSYGICRTWKEMIQHYIEEESLWNKAQERTRIIAVSSFTYVLTHDIKAVKQGKPLVKVASQEERMQPATSYYHGLSRSCQPCSSVGLRYRGRVDGIVDHLKETHLINEPVEGKHYY